MPIYGRHAARAYGMRALITPRQGVAGNLGMPADFQGAPGRYHQRIPEAFSGAYFQPRTLGAPSIEKVEGKVEKYQGKVDAGQRCGFPPSKQKCNNLLEKWRAKLETAQLQQAALQDVLSQTSPEATAAAVTDAAAAQVAAIQASQSNYQYIFGGIALLGAIGVAAMMLLSGRRRQR